MDRLLPHGHVLGVFLQSIKRRVWLHADAIVMILRVASGRRMREKAETSEKEKTCQCYLYRYPPPSVFSAYKHHHINQIQNGNDITVISIHNNLFLFVPGAKAPSPQTHEDGANELAEGGSVDRIQFLFLTVPQVMVIERAPGQAHPLCCLIVVQQPLQLKRRVK